jgi:hypothetical protein
VLALQRHGDLVGAGIFAQGNHRKYEDGWLMYASPLNT